MSVSARRRSQSVYWADMRLTAPLAPGSYSGSGGLSGPSDGRGVAVTITGVGGCFDAAAAEVAGTNLELWAAAAADEDDEGGGGAGCAL